MGLLDSVLGSAIGALAGQAGGAGNGGQGLMQLVAALIGGNQSGAGGLGALVGQLTQGGLGEAVQSWVSTGPNLPVSGEQLSAALGDGQLAQLAQQFGLPVEGLSGQLAQLLPQVVDQLTPNGELPAAGQGVDLGGMVGQLLGGLTGGR